MEKCFATLEIIPESFLLADGNKSFSPLKASMSFEIYYTECVVDLKAISRVLLLQSSNLWVSAAIVVGKSIFLALIDLQFIWSQVSWRNVLGL